MKSPKIDWLIIEDAYRNLELNGKCSAKPCNGGCSAKLANSKFLKNILG